MAAADYRLMTEATGQRIAIALENLAGFGDYLTTADVVNNLTSTSTTAPLSAAMGKALNEKIKSTTVTITTSSAGVAGLLSNSKIVYAIVCNSENVYPMFVPFIGTNGTTFVMVFDYSTTALTKLVNTQLNVTVYYQDLPA